MRKFASLVLLTAVFGLVPLVPIAADHTDPHIPLSRLIPENPGEPATRRPLDPAQGGEWTFIKNFPNDPSSDLKFFTKRVGTRTDIYAASGTLGQGRDGAEQPLPSAETDWVGQRIIRLTRGNMIADPVNPVGDPALKWVADHGSAHCLGTNAANTLSLQHDSAVTGYNNPKLLIDNADAPGRCHDAAGNGGLEIIDISRVQDPNFEPREIHLTKHEGHSHTVTVDATRPWIVYNNTSELGGGRPWIDVLDIRTCLLPDSLSLEQKRDRCRPKVYRIPFQDAAQNPAVNGDEGKFDDGTSRWSAARDIHFNSLNVTQAASCHDITAKPGRIYCAGLSATLIFDVRNLTDDRGNIRGTPLDCDVQPAAPADAVTTAMVTDCVNDAADGTADDDLDDKLPRATGWKFLGTFNHPGRDCTFPHNEGVAASSPCNDNAFIDNRGGIAVSHEADPDPTGKFLAVTDEKGGGAVPPGAACAPNVDQPVVTGNGGVHFFNITNPSNIQYARMPRPASPPGPPADDRPAVFVSNPVVASPDFCTSHVMEFIPGRQRFVIAWYTQGTKIVDYFVDANNKITFNEVASFTPPGANQWTSQPFVIQYHNGPQPPGCPTAPCVTYYFMASDVDRGKDIFKWTGPAGPVAGARAGGGYNGDDDDGGGDDRATNAALGGAGLVLLPAAMWLRRRRLNSRH